MARIFISSQAKKAAAQLVDWRALVFAPMPFARWWDEELSARRLYLWVPVLLGLGVSLYFLAPQEPLWWAAGALSLVFGGLAYRLRETFALHLLCFALYLIFTGFASVALRATLLDTVLLPRMASVELKGYVARMEARDDDIRVLLRVMSAEGWPAAAGQGGEVHKPQWVRVNIPQNSPVKAGDLIAAKATLFPPPQPSRPQGYDFARDAYFMNLSAVGVVRKPPSIIENGGAGAKPLVITALSYLEDWRARLHQRIVAAAGGGDEAEVAAALITGKRAGIEAETNEALQAAGLIHVLSISGLHLMLFGGALFWLMRQALVMIPGLADRFAIKKLAAFITALGVTFYAILSGFEVAAERALIMMLVSLGAIMLNRRALSLRNVATSAILVLLHRPESVISISAQLSFASVTALIAAYEAGLITGKGKRGNIADGLYHWVFYRSLFTLRVLLVSGLVATAATTPLIAFYFQRMNPWGILGNVLTEPITAFIIMPAGLLGLIAMPFGFDGPIWQLMAWGCARMIDIAEWVGALDHAVMRHAAFSKSVVVAFALAFLWLCLWRSSLRLLSGLGVFLSLVLLIRSPAPPLGWIDAQGRTVAVQGQHGQLVVMNGSANKFAVRVWLDASGDGREVDDPSLKTGVVCTEQSCTVIAESGRKVVLIRKARAIREACASADLVIAPFWEVYDPCRAMRLDKRHIPRGSAAALRLEGETASIEAARPASHARPWFPPAVAAVAQDRPRAQPKPSQRSQVLEPWEGISLEQPEEDGS